ncbi:MAG: DUF6799 domain-containing protein [Bacteroidota bacterium]
MKKLILVIAISFLSLSAFTQDYGQQTQNDSKMTSAYCAMLKDGKIILMAEGKEVYSDLKLADGTKVKTDGTVEKSDKTKILLKNGECIDQDGNIIPADRRKSEKDKLIQEDKDQKMEKK